MKNILKKYGIELLIILVSLILGLIEAFFIKDTNLQAVIVAIGLLLALSTLAIRREIADQISEQFELFSLVRKITNEY
jgi:ribose/xylose/arabinose/galactoside ABC-type transport system permease subunit